MANNPFAYYIITGRLMDAEIKERFVRKENAQIHLENLVVKANAWRVELGKPEAFMVTKDRESIINKNDGSCTALVSLQLHQMTFVDLADAIITANPIQAIATA